MANPSSSFKYEIVKQFEVLSEKGNMKKEFNLISYGDAAPKYDIRNWQYSDDGEKKLLKGITLSLDEIHLLKEKLNEMDEI